MLGFCEKYWSNSFVKTLILYSNLRYSVFVIRYTGTIKIIACTISMDLNIYMYIIFGYNLIKKIDFQRYYNMITRKPFFTKRLVTLFRCKSKL